MNVMIGGSATGRYRNSMTEKMQIYKCEVCGNIVEIIHAGKGELICCGKTMKLFKENTVDAAKEKHVPVIEKGKGKLRVKVGSVPHPMEEKHYIEWVQLIEGNKSCREFLSPGQQPETVFSAEGENVFAREYCSIHGLWKGESND